jgi:hypothetical protein
MPETKPKTPTTNSPVEPPLMDNSSDKSKDTILELYKLEYTTGVKRHDDIYKSMWTNFSYMAILAGGILTFGKGVLPIDFIGAIACVPLIYWFWSSFLPLDRYGNQVSETMEELEKFINVTYFGNNQNQSSSDSTKKDLNERQSGIFLYTDFESRKKEKKYKGKNPLIKIRQNIRVIHSAVFFTIILHSVFLGLLINGTYKCVKYGCSNNSSETTEKKLESINNTLGNVSNSINSLKNSYEINAQKSETVNKNLNAQSSNKTSATNTVKSNSNE